MMAYNADDDDDTDNTWFTYRIGPSPSLPKFRGVLACVRYGVPETRFNPVGVQYFLSSFCTVYVFSIHPLHVTSADIAIENAILLSPGMVACTTRRARISPCEINDKTLLC
jgi:hypothetical protein